MAYEKQNFRDGMTLRAKHLNNIEECLEGVSGDVDNLKEYTSYEKFFDDKLMDSTLLEVVSYSDVISTSASADYAVSGLIDTIDTTGLASISVEFKRLSTTYDRPYSSLALGVYEYSADGKQLKLNKLKSSTGQLILNDNTAYVNVYIYIGGAKEAGLSGYELSVEGVHIASAYKKDYVLSEKVVVPQAERNKATLEKMMDDTQGIPNYYNEYIDEKIAEVRQRNLVSGRKGDSFIFCTDVHVLTNAGYSTLLANKISKNTNNKMFVCGGDVLTTQHTKLDALNILRDYIGQLHRYYGCNFRYVFGNHDLNTVDAISTSKKLYKSEAYSACYKPFEKEVVNDEVELYYYWDNPTQKIRYISLSVGSTMEFGEAQFIWFINVIKSTPADYNIGIFSHSVFSLPDGESDTYEYLEQGLYLVELCDAINTKGKYTLFDTEYDFSDTSLTIMFIMTGHLHYDYSEYSSSGIPIIVTAADRLTERSATLGTVQEQCFDVVDINKVDRIIYCTRVGCGENRTFTY